MTSYFDSEQSISSIKSAFFAYTDLNRSEKSDPILSTAKVSFLASTTTSDLLDLLEYEVDFKFDKDKYKKYLLCNYFDSFTKDIVGNNLDDLDVVNNILLPQLSSDSSSKEITDSEGIDNEFNSYFGMFVDNEKSYIILDVPGNIPLLLFYTEDNSEELFDSSYVTKDNDFTGNINNFIGSHNPIIALKFGSEPNLIENEDGTTYYDYEITKELTDRKVICIEISSSNDKITDIDIYKASWNNNINKYRNMNKFSVRNDYFLETYKKDISPVRLDNEFLIDKNNDVLLGIVDNNRNQPVYNRKLLRTKIENSNNYYTYYNTKVFNRVDGVKNYKSIYNSLSNKNIGSNIELEQNWNIDVNFNNESETCDDNYDESSSFYQIIISCNEFGTVVPTGRLSINKDTLKTNLSLINSTIKATPLDGYYLDYILFNSNKISNLGEINDNGFLNYFFSPSTIYIPIEFYDTDGNLLDIPEKSLVYTYYNNTEEQDYPNPIIIDNNQLQFTFGNYSVTVTLSIISNISKRYELVENTFDIDINSDNLLKTDDGESLNVFEPIKVTLKEREYKLSIIDNTINSNKISSYYIDLECTTEIFYSYNESVSFTVYNLKDFSKLEYYKELIEVSYNGNSYDNYELIFNEEDNTCTISIPNITTDSLIVTLN